MQLDGSSLTLESFKEIVLGRAKVSLHPKSKAILIKSRAAVDKAAKSGERVYSINTGFGFLSKVTIDPSQLEELQENLIRSHCTGLGEFHTEDESRGILLLRTNVLAKGFSGVRPELVELLIELLNKGVHPLIPTKGSVGACGDLAPLAHLAAVLIGEGEAYFQGQKYSGKQAMEKAGIRPIKLAPKEGLSLINGTQQMTALGALNQIRAEQLSDLADLICTASLEGVLGSPRAYVDWVQATRPYPGQNLSAKRLCDFMTGSEIYESHESCDRVQDPYSFRCAPQVHGASRDLLSFVHNTLKIEMNSSTDNPLVHPDTGELVSNGNFHGQPVAFALDIQGMALSEYSSLSERRIAKLIDPGFSELPAFLVKNEGLNSGFMIPHVAAASLVSENKLLTHPGSTDSIPTSNEKEDHVSMGPLCARKAKTILENTEYVLSIEAIASSQALEFRKPLQPGKGPRALYSFIRKHVAALERDREFRTDIEKVAATFRDGKFHAAMKQEGLW